MNRHLQKASRVLAILIAVAFATYGLPAVLVGEPVAEDAAAAELLVKCGWLSDILVWNPLNLEMVEDWVACFLMYNALFTYDRDWNLLEGDLAREWSVEVMDNGTPSDDSDDYVLAHVRITENAYWRNLATLDDDTHPVTAEDVKFTFDMIIEENAGAFPLYLKGIDEITVIDDYNLDIKTSYIKATLFEDMSGIPIVPKYLWEDYSNPCTATMKPADLVGSGPFVFDSMLSASWWKFVKAPNYHMEADYGEDGDIDYDGILFTMHGSAIELAIAMNSGQEDCIVMTGEPNIYLNILEESSTVTKAAVQENGICDIAINAIPFENRTTTGGGYGLGFELLVDPYLREAILMCLNKSHINENIMMNLSKEATSVIQPGYWHTDPTPAIEYNPAAAKAYLEDHGYADTDSNGYLECVVTDTTDWRHDFYGVELEGIRCQAPNTDPSYYLICQAWEASAKEAGIGLVAEEKSEGVMVSSAWYKADYDIWVWHWGWGPEPLSTLSVWITETMTPGGDNCQMPMGPYEDYVNETLGLDLTCTYNGSIFDQVWMIAGQTVDMEKRQALVFLLQQWVYDSRCEYPPYYDVGLYAYSTATFTNWGDWDLHNGQNFVQGLPWLWLDLEPASNTPPVVSVPLAESYEVMVNENQRFSIEVSDPQGDPITATWDFGDGSAPAEPNSTTDDTSETPITFTQDHVYTTVESGLELSVTISDGLPGHDIILTATVDVVDVYDAVPLISAVSRDPLTAYVGEDVSWSATFSDLEAASLHVTWNWADGTYTVEDLTPATVGASVTSTPTHSWDNNGFYDVIVSVWDNYGEEDGLHNQSTGTGDNEIEIIVNEAPDAPSVSEISTNVGIWTVCQATTSDPDADVITVTWEWDDGTFNVTTHDTSGAQGETVTSVVKHLWAAEGSYDVTVWADDGYVEENHNVSTDATATVSLDAPLAPSSLTISVNPDPAIVNGTTQITVSAFDANGDAIAFTIDFGDESDLEFDDSSAASTDIQSVTFDHVYTAEDSVTITVYADDGTGTANVSKTYDLEVIVELNAAPQLSLQTSYSALYNQSFVLTPTGVSDADGDDVTVWYEWGDESDKTMGDADNNYAGTHVYSAVETFTITVSVDDGTGIAGHNVSKTTTVTVSEANYRPKIASVVKEPVKTEYAPEETIYINVTAYDIEGDAITVVIDFGDGSAVVRRPLAAAGAGINTTTSFEHAYAEDGTYTITVTLEDEYDHSKAWNFQTVTAKVVTEETKSNIMLYAGIGLLLVIVIVAALMLMMKRKNKGAADMGGMSGMEGMAAPEDAGASPPPPEEPSS